jgi:hypothetical protein
VTKKKASEDSPPGLRAQKKYSKKFEKFFKKVLTNHSMCGIIYTVEGETSRRISEAERKRTWTKG